MPGRSGAAPRSLLLALLTRVARDATQGRGLGAGGAVFWLRPLPWGLPVFCRCFAPLWRSGAAHPKGNRARSFLCKELNQKRRAALGAVLAWERREAGLKTPGNRQEEPKTAPGVAVLSLALLLGLPLALLRFVLAKSAAPFWSDLHHFGDTLELLPSYRAGRVSLLILGRRVGLGPVDLPNSCPTAPE